MCVNIRNFCRNWWRAAGVWLPRSLGAALRQAGQHVWTRGAQSPQYRTRIVSWWSEQWWGIEWGEGRDRIQIRCGYLDEQTKTVSRYKVAFKTKWSPTPEGNSHTYTKKAQPKKHLNAEVGRTLYVNGN